MRRDDLKDITVLIRKTCPQCNSTGVYDIPNGQCTCSNCRGVEGVRVEEEISIIQLMCIMEQYKQDNPLELSEGLKEVYAATAALLNQGRRRDVLKAK